MRWILAWLACGACSFHRGQLPNNGGPDGSPVGSDGSPAGSDSSNSGSDAVTMMPHVTIAQSMIAHPAWTQSDTSLVASLPAPVGAGDVIAVIISWDDAHSIMSLGDSAADTFTGPQMVRDTANNKYLFIAYGVSTAGGSPTVTGVFNGAVTGRMMVIAELAGANASAPLDSSSQAQASANTTTDGVTAGDVATTGTGELVLAGTTETTGKSGETIAAGTGAMLVQSLTESQSGGDAFAVEAYELVPTGNAAPAFTYSKTGAALCVSASFKP